MARQNKQRKQQQNVFFCVCVKWNEEERIENPKNIAIRAQAVRTLFE